MACEIIMPQLGLTITKGSVSTWLQNPRYWVEKGGILFTVQMNNVEMEVESFGFGYLSEIEPYALMMTRFAPAGERA